MMEQPRRWPQTENLREATVRVDRWRSNLVPSIRDWDEKEGSSDVGVFGSMVDSITSSCTPGNLGTSGVPGDLHVTQVLRNVRQGFSTGSGISRVQGQFDTGSRFFKRISSWSARRQGRASSSGLRELRLLLFFQQRRGSVHMLSGAWVVRVLVLVLVCHVQSPSTSLASWHELSGRPRL